MLAYFSISISAIGALIGLVGKSWDERKKSLLKFTFLGWASIFLIAIGTIISLIEIHNAEAEAQQYAKNEKRVKGIVYEKIYNGCWHLTIPIRQLFHQYSPALSSSFENENEKEYEICKSLITDQGLSILSSINFVDSVEQGTAFDEWDESYLEYFHGYYNSSNFNTIENVMGEWKQYIDLEDIPILDALVNHGYLSWLASIRPYNNLEDKKEYLEKVGVFYTYDDSDVIAGHKDFFEKLIKIWKKSSEIHYAQTLTNTK